MATAREISLQEENIALQKKVDSLQNQLAAVIAQWKGKKTEKLPVSSDQIALFELEAAQAPDTQEQTEEITYTRSKRKEKPVRSTLPESLRREIIEIYPDTIAEGARLIGQEITEVLEIVQAEVYVRQFIRYKYALPQDQGVLIAPMPKLPIYKGMAGASILAHLLIAKYIDHLPFYRQVQIFSRLGITLSRSTINGWFKGCCELLKPLYDLQLAKILLANYLMLDESTIKVQDQNKKGGTHLGYHWVYYSPLNKIVLFDYQPGRKAEYPKALLKTYSGALQTDGYQVYDYFERCPRIVLLACMAHARRKFWEAKKNDQLLADQALAFFRRLYFIEKRAREGEMTHDERYDLRQKEARPIMDALKSWLDEHQIKTTPKSAMGKAINYTLNQWHKLERYLDDGRYEIDNNLVENSIRPMALGRKNYLFCGNHEAAQNAAILYSLLGTCLKNNVNPNEWLPFALERLPYCDTEEEYEALLPQNFVAVGEEAAS